MAEKAQIRIVPRARLVDTHCDACFVSKLLHHISSYRQKWRRTSLPRLASRMHRGACVGQSVAGSVHLWVGLVAFTPLITAAKVMLNRDIVIALGAVVNS